MFYFWATFVCYLLCVFSRRTISPRSTVPSIILIMYFILTRKIVYLLSWELCWHFSEPNKVDWELKWLWWESMRWNQMVGPITPSPASHFAQFCEGFVAGQNQSHRYGWWVALTSSIWQHRNQLVFEGNHFQPTKVMMMLYSSNGHG